MKSSNSVNLAAGVAAVLSLTATMLCLVTGPMLIAEISSIRSELDEGMIDFRIQSNDLWREMMGMGGKARVRRQIQAAKDIDGQQSGFYYEPPKGEAVQPAEPTTYPNPDVAVQETGAPGVSPPSPLPPQCNCEQRENTCPEGPPGAPGEPGFAGPDGLPGQDGIDGVDAEDVQAERPQLGCTNCPIGPPGQPGTPGRTGPRGMRGSSGQSGPSGRPGRAGPPGPRGDTGKDGPAGGAGGLGPQGLPATQARGRPGAKGPVGEEGPEGDPGTNGYDAEDGAEGFIGAQGGIGPLGTPGPIGPPGTPGYEGEPGADAEYCPCPDRGSEILRPATAPPEYNAWRPASPPPPGYQGYAKAAAKKV